MRFRRTLTFAAIVLLGTAARLTTWHDVFTPGAIRFVGDTDPHYHVLRAERLLSGDPDGDVVDRQMDYPHGARIVWPPLFDATIAAAARAITGAPPARADLERVAAGVPVALGIAALPFVAALAAAASTHPLAGAIAAVLLATTPAATDYGALGRPDQHVAELLLFLFVLVAFARATTGSSRAWVVALGIGEALAFWNWQGSALYLALLGAVTAVAFTLWSDRDAARRVVRAYALGGAVGTAALAASLVALGPPGAIREASLNGLTGVEVAMLGAAAFVGAELLAWERWRPRAGAWTRAAVVTAAAALPIALAAAFPGAREAIAGGLTALGRSDPWYARIGEFQPLFFDPSSTFSRDLAFATFHVTPLAVAPLAAIPAIRRTWDEAPHRRTALLLVAIGGTVFLVLTLRSVRFRLYLAPFACAAGALVVDDVLRRWSGRRRWAALSVAAVVVFAPLATLPRPGVVPADASVASAAAWLRTQPDAESPRRAVMAPWDDGHLIQYYGGKPVVVTPFGTALGERGMRDHAAFATATSAEERAAILRRRSVRWVLVHDAFGDVLGQPFAPAIPTYFEVAQDASGGGTIAPTAAFWRSTMGALYYDGDRPPQLGPGPALETLRLVFETPGAEDPVKIFEVVEGARMHVRGAAPGDTVSASVSVVTPLGRRIPWRTEAVVGADGVAVLGIPYATGWNGASVAGPCRVRSPAGSASVEIPDVAVRSGLRVDVVLDRAATAAATPATRR